MERLDGVSLVQNLHIPVEEGACGYDNQAAKFPEYQAQQLCEWERDNEKPSSFAEQVAGCLPQAQWHCNVFCSRMECKTQRPFSFMCPGACNYDR